MHFLPPTIHSRSKKSEQSVKSFFNLFYITNFSKDFFHFITKKFSKSIFSIIRKVMQKIMSVINMSIVFIRAVIIYIAVIIALRIMGKRQIGEMTPHELVITILVSQVAIIPLQDNAMPLANMIIPILIFVSFEIIVSAVSMKSISFRNIIQGKPIFVIRNGKVDEKQLKRLRITIDDLMDAVREKGYFDLSEIQDAVVETNGTVSVLPKTKENPVTPSQLNIDVKEKSTPVPVVTDGKPVSEYFGQNKIMDSEIKLLVTKSGKDITDILLLTIDDNGKINIIEKKEK